VIVPPDAFDLWLDCMNVDVRIAEALIKPAPDDQLEFWPVSAQVNRTANDNPKLLDAIVPGAETKPRRPAAILRPKQAKDDGQGVLF
jgi:hypothetical protein